MTANRRIILCVDHPIVVAGLRNIIQPERDLEILGVAASGSAALKLVQENQPDLVVIDLPMPFASDLVLLRRIAEQATASRILMLGLDDGRAHVCLAMQAGAHGYVLKRSDPQHFIAAVRAVLAGGIYVDPPNAALFFRNRPASRGRRWKEQFAPELTDRELEVLKRAALGFTNKEIARHLDIGVKTVETYKARGSEKIGLKSRVDLVRHALSQGWLASA